MQATKLTPEFALIRAHFAALGAARSDVLLGVGDDCALLAVPAGQQLAVSIDTLAAGVHFLPDCDPEAIGHKCLAVGLSDLAAMGAEPAWATLALTLPATLPRESPDWLAAFAHGFGRLARAHRVALVGGDTTRGPLSITVQVHGLVPVGAEIRRAGARPGDLVCVSGTLGDAGLALRELLAGQAPSPARRARLERPTPRVALGLALRGLASAMIDCSDGLAADLGHILEASGVGAELDLAALPLEAAVAAAVDLDGDWGLPLAAGDDYELCFCLPPAYLERLPEIAARCGCPLTPIGRILSGPGLVCRAPDGAAVALERVGFDHFH
ncbi:thiamine-phosphate kinase [uncultured Thiodictyon sp.]|uniref:thiamine-phosphate kinase n=1 Tax=uncultured Thiodictyon sp. TaxID=1846217 RepID=UPI0025E64F76|nr:thiamine-phosphate kinase [uncultured Thiodictyon sp.]